MLKNTLITLLILPFFLHCTLTETTNTVEQEQIIQQNHTNFLKDTLPDDVYEVVEEMPRFPGCEDIEGSIDAKKQCADKKMLEYLYKNMKFSLTSEDCMPAYLIVIRFIINEKGKVIAPKVIRPEEPCGKGAIGNSLELIKMMNDLPEPWIPGKQRGKPVKVVFNLPIRLNLKG